MTAKLQQLIDVHSALLERNPYCYFELAYCRSTGWVVWICSNHAEDDPKREVICKGQGSTPEEAADNALDRINADDKSNPNRDGSVPNVKSKCCLAPVVVPFTEDGTNWFECTACGKPCDTNC